jgi:NADH-quinone oxidoreductase subunit C
MESTAVLDALRQALPGARVEPALSTDMPSLYVDRDDLVRVCSVLKSEPGLQFSFLADVTAADYFPAQPRFEVVYHLVCLGDAFAQPGHPAAPARRLRLKVRVPGDDAHLATVSGVWATAAWPEREVFDLFGIAFDEHPDLRRILMPEDWEGHPLRKDYPVQVRQDAQISSALQLSPEEFAASVRAQRERADEAAQRGAAAGHAGGHGRE